MQAHLPVADVQVALDLPLRPDDGKAVEVGQERQRAKERHHHVPHARGTLRAGRENRQRISPWWTSLASTWPTLSAHGSAAFPAAHHTEVSGCIAPGPARRQVRQRKTKDEFSSWRSWRSAKTPRSRVALRDSVLNFSSRKSTRSRGRILVSSSSNRPEMLAPRSPGSDKLRSRRASCFFSSLAFLAFLASWRAWRRVLFPHASIHCRDRPPPSPFAIRAARAPPSARQIVLAALTRLRWLAVVGQLGLRRRGVGAAPAAAGGADRIRDRHYRALQHPAHRVGPVRPPSAWLVRATILLDVLLLTALLYLTGGPANPFAALYLVHVAMAVSSAAWRGPGSSSRPRRRVTGCCCGGTWRCSRRRASRRRWGAVGNWAALVLVSVLIAAFIGRVIRALRQRELELVAVRERAAKNEQLAGLTTLAAGAAHELNTPLGTIAVVAKELELSCGGGETTPTRRRRPLVSGARRRETHPPGGGPLPDDPEPTAAGRRGRIARPRHRARGRTGRPSPRQPERAGSIPPGGPAGGGRRIGSPAQPGHWSRPCWCWCAMRSTRPRMIGR